MKHSLQIFTILAFTSLLLIYFHSTPQLTMVEESANFEENDKTQLRFIISKAGIMFNTNSTAIAQYVKNEVRLTFPSFWNVAVYTRQDFNTKFYLTGTYDSTHRNKRYFQVTDTQPYGFSILILENNNTQINSIASLTPPKAQVTEKSLQYTKTKSPTVSSSQQAGIDLAITTAYTWNKNIIDFSKVLQTLTQTNLNEHWEVCTSFENLSNFSFLYTSQYDHWIEYSGYGIGATRWHVYIWRNYISG